MRITFRSSFLIFLLSVDPWSLKCLATSCSSAEQLSVCSSLPSGRRFPEILTSANKSKGSYFIKSLTKKANVRVFDTFSDTNLNEIGNGTKATATIYNLQGSVRFRHCLGTVSGHRYILSAHNLIILSVP